MLWTNFAHWFRQLLPVPLWLINMGYGLSTTVVDCLWKLVLVVCHTLLLNRTALYFVLQMHGAIIVLLNLVTCTGEDVCSWNSTISGSHMQHGYTVLVSLLGMWQQACWRDLSHFGRILTETFTWDVANLCCVWPASVGCVIQCLATVLGQFGQRLLSTSRLQLTNLNVTKWLEALSLIV
jgi:hypothetical protein